MNILTRKGKSIFSILLINRFKFFNSIFLAASILFSLPASNAHPAQVTLAWDASTDSNIAGYKVHYGNSSGSYQAVIDVGKTTSCTISTLLDGTTYYFAATDYNTSGGESAYSNEVSYTTSAACTYSISPTSQSTGSSGGPGTVSVTASSGCTWTAVSNASWITVTSNGNVTGNGTVNYSVSANSGTTSRTGTMTIAGKTFTVNQSGTSCSYSISPASQSFNASGGTGSVSVAAQIGCSWNSSCNVSWISLTSGVSGTTNGSVGYSVSANTNNTSRTGTITIAGKTFTVTQSGSSLNSYTITAVAGSNGSISPSGTVAVGYGASQSFTITPARGYRIADVQVDGVSVGRTSTYSFGNVTADHTINASFRRRWGY